MFIKRELKKLFIAVFREVFALDPDFPYNEVDSSIIISSRYAKPKSEDLLPQIVISTNNYSSSTESFYNNFLSEAPGSVPGTITRRKFTNTVQFQMLIDILDTNKEECEEIGDKVFNILNHEYAELFKRLNLTLLGVGVSEVIPKEQYPQYTYTCSVTVSGTFRLEWQTYRSNEELFKKVKLSIESLDE